MIDYGLNFFSGTHVVNTPGDRERDKCYSEIHVGTL